MCQFLMGVWGKELLSVLFKTNRIIPLFLENCFSAVLTKWVDVEGLFRVNGSKKTFDLLKNQLEMTDRINDLEKHDPYVVCNLISRFVQNIPNQILVRKNLDKFIAIRTLDDAKRFIDCLPDLNRIFLSRLLGFFRLVSDHSETNLMGIPNIARLAQPILIEDPVNPLKMAEDDVLKLFLEHYFELFPNDLAITEQNTWIESKDFESRYNSLKNRLLLNTMYNESPAKTIEDDKKLNKDHNCRIITIDELSPTDLFNRLMTYAAQEMKESEKLK